MRSRPSARVYRTIRIATLYDIRDSKRICPSSKYWDGNVRWPRRVLPRPLVCHVEHAPTGQTDRQTDGCHYAFR